MIQSIAPHLTISATPAAPGALKALADVLVLEAGGEMLATALQVAYTVRSATRPHRIRTEGLAREEAQLRERLTAIEREKAA